MKNLTGERFCRLVVVKPIKLQNRKTAWLCKCDCGNEKIVFGYNLVKGATRSCGCYNSDALHNRMIDMTGQHFGKLTVISCAGKETYKDGRAFYKWNCVCECGNNCVADGLSLRQGRTVSCGCIRRNYATKHGLSKTPIYGVWTNMKSRCFNPNATEYENYGGRGISVCETWKNDFESFYRWAIQNGYSDGLEIDRIDNDAGYCPENCRFVSRTENLRNTSRNRRYYWKGKEYTVKELSDMCGLSSDTIRARIEKHGWSVENAVTIPLQKSRYHKK